MFERTLPMSSSSPLASAPAALSIPLHQSQLPRRGAGERGAAASARPGGRGRIARVADSLAKMKPAAAAYAPPRVPKSDSSRRTIRAAIRMNGLFPACSADELEDYVDAFREVRHARGSVVVREGDRGRDGFRVLSGGSASVHEGSEVKRTLRPGAGFGEVAPSEGSRQRSRARAATVVRAGEDCSLWFLDRRTAKAIAAWHEKKRLDLKVMLLEKVRVRDGVALGEALTPDEMRSLAASARIQEYSPGQVIVRQGEAGDALYAIASGRVDVYVRGTSAARPVAALGAEDALGDSLNRGALLDEDGVWAATCVAAGGAVRCVALAREELAEALGVPASELRGNTRRELNTPVGRGRSVPLYVYW